MQQSQNKFTLQSILVPSPRTKRGQSSFLDIANDHFLYFNGPTLIIRPLDLNKTIKYFVHKSQILAAKFSPDGKLIASIDQKGTLIVHQIGQKQLFQYKTYENVYLNAKALDWTSDKKRICIVGSGKNNFGRVLLLQSGTNAGQITGISANLTCCTFRIQRPYNLAVAGDQFSVKFFQGPPYKFVKSSQKIHSNFVNVVKFSPSGTLLLSVSSDKKIVLFNGTTFQLFSQKLNTHAGSIYGADWINQKSFITVSADKTIKVWAVQNLQQICMIPCCNAQQQKNIKKVDNFQVAVKAYQNLIYSLSLNGQIKVYNLKNIQPKSIQFNKQNIENEYAGWLQKPCKIIYFNQKHIFILDSQGKIIKLIGQHFISKLVGIKNKIVTKSIIDGIWNQKLKKLMILWGDGTISELQFTDIKLSQLQQSFFIQDNNARYLMQSSNDNYDFYTLNDKINGFKQKKIVKSSKIIQQDITYAKKFETVIILGTIKGNLLIYDSENLDFISKINISSSKISCINLQILNVQNKSYTLISGDALGKLKILNYNPESKSLKQLPQCLGNHQSLISSIKFLKSQQKNSTANNLLLTMGMDNKINLWQKIYNQQRYKRIQQWKNIHNYGILSSLSIQNKVLLTVGGDYLIKKWRINF